MKYLNFLRKFNLSVGLLCLVLLMTVAINCGGAGKIENLKFKIVKQYDAADDIDSPYFFASIFRICANAEYIYVADWKTYTIKIFDHDFNLVKKFGKKGKGPQEFGKIFSDMACDDRQLYVATINKLYVYSAAGEFEKELLLKTQTRSLFAAGDRFIIKPASSDRAFTVIDRDGNTVNAFYDTPQVVTRDCGKHYAMPEAYMTVGGDFFVFDSTRYHISRYDIDTSASATVFTGGDDFHAVNCVRENDGSYYIVGGYSSMIEGRNELYYFYNDSNKQDRIDVFGKPGNGGDTKLVLKRRGSYRDRFRPYCMIPNSNRFIGTFMDSPHILAVCTLTGRGK